MPWADEAYRHLLLADPPMAALVARQGILTRVLPPSDSYFARLLRAIVGQQISVKAAASIYGRIAEAAGDPPAPAAIMALADEHLRGCGLSQAKLLAARDLAMRSLDGRLDIVHLETLPDEEVRSQLVAVRGIGRWTADMFLLFALGRPDVLPAEDLGVRNAARRLYALENSPPPGRIHRLAEEGRWHPYASAAAFYLWDSLTTPV